MTATPVLSVKTTRAPLLRFALPAGVTAASIHYSQPLLPDIAETFGVAESRVAPLPALTQAGFALSLLLVMPLADIVSRRALIAVLAGLAAIPLTLTATAGRVEIVLVSALALGLCNCVPQLLVAYAASVEPKRTGHAVGTVLSGVYAGILLSRTFSGTVAAALSWRTVYASAAILMLGVIVTALFALPEPPSSPTRTSYGDAVSSTFRLLRTLPVLRRHAGYGAAGFMTFMLFWSTYSLHLERNLGRGSASAGLLGLVGLAGITVAPIAGRTLNSGRFFTVFALSALAMSAGFAGMLTVGRTLWALVLGLILLDAGVAANQVANQTASLSIPGVTVNRLNAAFMFCYFIGGLAGSALGAALWTNYGWTGVAAAGTVVPLAALAHSAANRRIESRTRALPGGRSRR